MIIDLSNINLITLVDDPFTTKGSALTDSETDTNVITLGDFLILLQSSAIEVALYGSGTEYTTGDIVRYDGKLYEHIYTGSPPEITGELPTNVTYWEEITIGRIAHIINKDQYLDLGGANEVHVADIKANVDGMTTKFFTKTLSAAQVQSLNTVPIEAIAAVAGKAIRIESAWLEYDWQAAAYNDSHIINLITNSADDAQAVTTSNILTQTEAGVANFTLSAARRQLVENEPVNIYLTSGDVTTGDSPVIVSGYYQEITLNI